MHATGDPAAAGQAGAASTGARGLRWLDTGPRPAAWNMALDQVLLEGALERPTIRVYAWAEPSLTLGRFQPIESIPAALVALPAVRRASGGGAILHADELTYSAALPAALVQPRGGRVADSYRLLHAAVARALAELGAALDPEVQGDPSGPRRRRGTGAAAAPAEGTVALAGLPRGDAETEPFLCFSRRSGFDLTAGGRKLAGSAQRRVRGALLQHGSVPLGLDPSLRRAPGSVTLAEVAGRLVGYEQLASALRAAFAVELGVDLVRGLLSPDEEARAARLAETLYAPLRGQPLERGA